jgi:GAF domain-containing protein
VADSQDRSLNTVLATVGLPVLQALWLSPDGSAVVGKPYLLDPAEGSAAPPEAIALAVGARPGATRTLDMIRECANAGVAAVVVKSYGDPLEPVIEQASSCQLPLLLADDSVAWHHLYALLASAVDSNPVPVGEPYSAVATGDLFALANATAAMVGGAIAIEDPNQRVLAYSSVPGQPIDEVRQLGILGRRVPAEFRLADLYDRVRRSSGVERVELPGVRNRLAVAVRAGEEPLGSMWAIEGETGFAPDAERALADAARIASLHLLRLRTTADVERTARSEALRAVLLGRSSATPAALPGAETGELAVIGFQIAGAPRDADGTLRTRVTDLITVYCESVDRRSACLAIGETVYALQPVARSGDTKRLSATASRVLSRANESLRVRMRAGIGGPVSSVSAVPESRMQADRVLQVLADRGDGTGVASIAEVRTRTILLQLQELIAANPGVDLEVLHRMDEYDAQRQTQYLPTLRAYLDAFGDVPTASAKLILHQNTFRHRMRRIAELFEIDLNDPDERLVIWLLLRTRG